MAEVTWEAVEWDGLPSELPELGPEVGRIVVDTETSALSPDDGGISVVSLAWWEQQGGGDDGVCRYWAGAYAQGRYGKPEDRGVRSLFDGEDDELADAQVNLPEAEWWSLLDWLGRAGCGLEFHNAKFDLGHLRSGVMRRDGVVATERRGGWAGRDLSERLVSDTAVTCREVWPTRTAALKALGQELWGEDARAEQLALKKHLGPATRPRYDLVPWEVMKPYAAKDAVLTLRLGRLLWELVEQGQASRKWIRRELEVTKALYRMEWAGVPYPAKASRKVSSELRAREKVAVAQLPFKVTEAARYYFERDDQNGLPPVQKADGSWGKGLGLEPLGLTPTGRVQFTADTLDQLAKKDAPWARELAEVKKANTAVSLWYEGYADKVGADGRLRTMFRQTTSAKGGDGGTASGRFSVERVNLQAIPHDYRLTGSLLAGLTSPRGLIAEAIEQLGGGSDGGGSNGGGEWGGYELDLAQAELRVAARYAKCESMLELINQGQDLHGETTKALFGTRKSDHDWDEKRQVAKRGNFSLIFGCGWVTFQGMVQRESGIALSNSEARRIVNEWNALYPEYQQAIEEWSQTVQLRKKVELANGRFRHFKWGEDTHKAFNQKVQASLAEFGKDWLVWTDRYFENGDGRQVAKEAERAGIGRAGLVLVIHDSQVLLLPKDRSEQVCADVKQAGEQLWQQYWPGLPGGVDVKTWK